jgi:hypothetical protein
MQPLGKLVLAATSQSHFATDGLPVSMSWCRRIVGSFYVLDVVSNERRPLVLPRTCFVFANIGWGRVQVSYSWRRPSTLRPLPLLSRKTLLEPLPEKILPDVP